MKFITPIIASFIGICLAEETDVESGPDERKMNQVGQMLVQSDSINFATADIAQKFIRNYGCHCYIDGSKTVGQSRSLKKHPVVSLDDFDALCQSLARAQRCIDVDVANSEFQTQCRLEGHYEWHMDTGANTIMCGILGEDPNDTSSWAFNHPCRMQLCSLEKQFAEDILDMVANGYTKNNAWHRMDDTDYNAQCSKTVGQGGTDHGNRGEKQWSCCGTGLARKPYNDLIHVCCNDGSISSPGMCPP